MRFKLNRPIFFATVQTVLVLGVITPIQAQSPQPQESTAIAIATPNTSTARSDSPFLQIRPDQRNIKPMTPPSDNPSSQNLSTEPQVIVSYQIASKKETRTPVLNDVKLSATITRTQPSFEGLLPSGSVTEGLAGTESIIGIDGRNRIAGTTNFPWRTIVKLIMTFPNGAVSSCSGAIIGPFHILTAGHCAHSVDYGGWADTIEAIPGLDDTYMPYRSAWVTGMRSYNGWTDHQETQHDWALLTLDRNIGNFTGWMGRETADPSHSLYTGDLHTAGYPSDQCDSDCMYYDGDLGKSANTDNHWYGMDTMPGQSGSPVYRIVDGNRYIVTVHTSSADRTGFNHGTRLHQDKFDRLITWIAEDSAPTDKADLIDDGQAFASFNMPTIKQGASGFQIRNRVRNIGTTGSGTFRVSYYASADATITNADYLIGSIEMSSVGPFAIQDALWSGKFPSSIPPGKYWIGWVVDSVGNVDEFDEGNNAAYSVFGQLTVNTNKLFMPAIFKR